MSLLFLQDAFKCTAVSTHMPFIKRKLFCNFFLHNKVFYIIICIYYSFKRQLNVLYIYGLYVAKLLKCCHGADTVFCLCDRYLRELLNEERLISAQFQSFIHGMAPLFLHLLESPTSWMYWSRTTHLEREGQEKSGQDRLFKDIQSVNCSSV